MSGGGQQDLLRARLLGSLHHMGIDEITFLQILPPDTPEASLPRHRIRLQHLAEGDHAAGARIMIIRSSQPTNEILSHAAQADLMILGLQRHGRRQKVFGETVLHIARNTECGSILVNRKG